ncbi:hypothetical protein HK101_010290 [Irineochytrium annulatum]|nr:hypothetical protein HK101_010290 [Irineochytrium annulatum]
MFLTTQLVAVALVGAVIAPFADAALPGKIVGIKDQKNFCLMLPAEPGVSIGDSEGSAQSWCIGDYSTRGSERLPDGAIVSAHVIRTDAFIQVTGKINEDMLKIPDGDGGGQYDDAPKGSEPSSGGDPSLGFPHYVELVGSGVYCMRLCTSSGVDESSPCNMHKDTEGCDVVIGGSYEDGFTYEDRSGGVGKKKKKNGGGASRRIRRPNGKKVGFRKGRND